MASQAHFLALNAVPLLLTLFSLLLAPRFVFLSEAWVDLHVCRRGNGRFVGRVLDSLLLCAQIIDALSELVKVCVCIFDELLWILNSLQFLIKAIFKVD